MNTETKHTPELEVIRAMVGEIKAGGCADWRLQSITNSAHNMAREIERLSKRPGLIVGPKGQKAMSDELAQLKADKAELLTFAKSIVDEAETIPSLWFKAFAETARAIIAKHSNTVQ